MLSDSGPALSDLPAQRVGRAPLISARGLHLSFGGQAVLSGVDLDIYPGEVILLRGENGAGKTTLINALTGSLCPQKGQIEYRAGGESLEFRFGSLGPAIWRTQFAPDAVARRGVGRLWQDTRLFKSLNIVENLLVAGARNLGESPLSPLLNAKAARFAERDERARASQQLAALGLDQLAGAAGDMISLGQSKRVGIARAMAANASVLFLDEPLAGLDRAGIEKILTLVRDIVRERQVAIVIVEHIFNHPHLEGTVTTEWSLTGGRLTRDSVRQRSESGSQPPWFTLLAGQRTVHVDQLRRGATLTRFRRHEPLSGPPTLRVSGLTVTRGQRLIIGEEAGGQWTGLDLCLEPDEIAVLQAPNGWGKTTLLESIAGLTDHRQGHIYVSDHDVTHLTASERRRAGLQLNLARDQVVDSLTVRQHLAVAKARPGALDMLPDRLRDRRVANLSGGEKQLLALVSASSADNILVRLFDEPLAMLDREATDVALRLLEPDEGSSVLIAMPTFGES